MIKIIFILTIFAASISYAKLAGDWTGWGNWSFKGEAPGVDCSTMQMRFAETSEQISIESGFFDCSVVAMHLDKSTWKITEHELFDEQGKKVGTYDGQNLTVLMPSPNANTTIFVSIRRNANHFDYKEVWFNKIENIYVITGRLFTSGL